MRNRSEIPFEQQELPQINSDIAIARNIRARVGTRRIVGNTLGAAILVLGTACAGGVVEGKTRQGLMGQEQMQPQTQQVQEDLVLPVGGIQHKVNASERGYCPPIEKLNDGTGRFRVEVTHSCPEQAVLLGNGGWIVFRMGQAGFTLEGGAVVDSVVREGPNEWLVDPK